MQPPPIVPAVVRSLRISIRVPACLGVEPRLETMVASTCRPSPPEAIPSRTSSGIWFLAVSGLTARISETIEMAISSGV